MFVGAALLTLLRTIPFEVTRYQAIDANILSMNKLVSILYAHFLKRVALHDCESQCMVGITGRTLVTMVKFELWSNSN